jgi:hypothetical protein
MEQVDMPGRGKALWIRHYVYPAQKWDGSRVTLCERYLDPDRCHEATNLPMTDADGQVWCRECKQCVAKMAKKEVGV